METVGIAIVGLGYWGPNLLRNFYATPNCTVLYACDLDSTKIAKQQKSFPSVTYITDIFVALSDPKVQLIVVATKTNSHFSIAKMALEAGKHVFIEKPMTVSSAQAQELNTIAAQKNLHVFVDHTFLFSPSIAKISEYIQTDTLGDLLYFDSTRINLGIVQTDTNVLWDLAIHDLSILHGINNLQNVTSVLASGRAHVGQQVDVCHLHLEFNDGFSAHISVSWLSPVKIRKTIIGGTKSMLLYDDTEPSEKIRLYHKGVDFSKDQFNPQLPVYRSGDVLIPMLNTKETLLIETENVIRTIQNLETAKVSGQDGEILISILEKADESLLKKQIIYI